MNIGIRYALWTVLFLLLTGFHFGREISWESVQSDIHKKYPHVNHMTLDELRMLYSAGKTFYLYDVRSAKEFAISHLKGAVRLEDAGKVAVPKDSLIVAYCSVGVRSAAFVHQLFRLGFTEAYNLERSIFGWANRQLPLFREGREVHVVHPYNSRWGGLLDKKLHSYKP